MDSSNLDTNVTERPAEGQARQAIRNWREAAARGKARALELVVRQLRMSNDLADIERCVCSVLDPVAFRAVVLPGEPDGAVLGWMLPSLQAIDGTEYLAVTFESYFVSPGGVQGSYERVLVSIHPHVLARMFLRLQTTDLAEVRHEIEPTLDLYAALAMACAVLELRQIVMPTRLGRFRCDVRPDVASPCAIVARAWIAGDVIGRDAEVIDSIVTAMEKWRPTSIEDRARLEVPMEGPDGLARVFVEELAGHAWLGEPYEERGGLGLGDSMTRACRVARSGAMRTRGCQHLPTTTHNASWGPCAPPCARQGVPASFSPEGEPFLGAGFYGRRCFIPKTPSMLRVRGEVAQLANR